MKTKIILSLVVAITVALLSQPMFANITYTYTGNPFTLVTAPYTTSDMVTGSVELSSPLAANMGFTMVTPLAFSFSDGEQTITNPSFASISFATGPTGAITEWSVFVSIGVFGQIGTAGGDSQATGDNGRLDTPLSPGGSNHDAPGTWTSAVPDAGSSLALLSLSLTALGVAARRLQRAAA